ncbi:MAG: ribonuclease HII [Paracholeplasma sp.]|uniref:ribonuclease HII n=1 Tax=Acholeplasma brassicae TaxID=61635 RepID=UPI000695CDC6|nr:MULTISPECIES: ribonuclease HII [Paracholeplasma]MDY3195535.1 ribonuclease HII [Paracholeplasma sp.]
MTDINLYEFEDKLNSHGFNFVCGTDEAGRGPLAGPVVACAIILKKGAKLPGVDDSKKLSEKKRNALIGLIKEQALAISISMVSPQEIDQVNIYRSAKNAMISAIKGLKIKPDYVLADAMMLEEEIGIPTESLIKGDQRSISIAAASIIAKVTRDQYMKEMDELFPQYGFQKHKGYPTKAHVEAIKEHGICPIHRKTFEPIKSMLGGLK